MINTCPYCGSLLQINVHKYYCSYCDMEVAASCIQTEGSRRMIILERPASLNKAKVSTVELKKKSSYYLICLLRLVRQERTKIYNYLRVFRKANEQQADFLEHAEEAGGNYEYWTRKAWVLENILRDRSDFFPDKITESYLDGIVKNIEKSNRKIMIINS